MRERTRLYLLIAAQFVVMLDTAVLNIALPSIGRALSMDPVATAWLLNAYFLVFGGSLLVAGRAADVFGRRRVFLIGAALMVAGAAIGLTSSTAAILIAARLVQAAGAAALSPAAMSMILASTDGQARARAMSAWGAASTAGGATGVAVGGLVTAALGWPAIFGLTGFVAALVLAFGYWLLPAGQLGPRRPFDGPGATLVTTAAFTIAFAVLSVPQHGWLSAPVLIAAAGSVILVGLLVIRERRARDPLFPGTVMGSRRVAVALAVNLLGGAARIASFVLVAFLLQRVLRIEPGPAGMAMLPTSLIGFAVSVAVLPKLLARLGPERVVTAGCALLTAAHLIFAAAAPGSPYALRVLPGLALAAAGVALSFTPTTLVLAREVGRRDVGVGSGLASASAQLGGMFGIAVFGAVDAAATATAGSAAGLSAAFTVAAAFAAGAGALMVAQLLWDRRTTTVAPAEDPASPLHRPARRAVAQ
jgi:MFS family permease